MANSLKTRLDRLVLSARLALSWERLWPALAPMAGVAVVFVATAWMGFWVGLAPWAKGLGLALFALAFAVAGWRLLALTLPGRSEAMRRLEADAALQHQPLAAYEDELAPGADPFARRLWQVHRARAETTLAALKTPVPRADLVPHDPYAVRAAVGIVAFIGVLVGAGALAERLITPFDFAEPVETAAGPQFRLDAWVTPPAYTGRAPLFLSSATRVETDDGIHVPAGSLLTVRSQGEANLDLYLSGPGQSGAQALAPLEGEGAAAVDAMQGEVPIDGPMAVEVRRDGETIEGWQFVAEPDRAPTAAFIQRPQSTERDMFELRYTLDDDYGIASAEASAVPLEARAGRRPLVEDPSFALTLPSGGGLRGVARTVQDLTQHPYAGQEVAITLSATDGRGQVGASEAERFRLPARPFTNPVAKAVIEQRATLAMDADAHQRVIDAFDVILLDGEALGDAGDFLAMNHAYKELVRAETDDELRTMLDAMWELAIILEDDGLSDAERALRQAQERLRQALEDGASEEEIARLTEELRRAMQDYMRALAQNAPQGEPGQLDPNAQMITQNEIDDMLRRIEELARQGRHEEAEALLAEMQQMMENLQVVQRGQGQGQGEGQGQGQGEMGQEGQTLDELGRMIQRQQELMDETHRMDEGQGQPGQGQGQGRGQRGQGQSPFGQSPFGQPPFGQPPFGQFDQSPFGNPPGSPMPRPDGQGPGGETELGENGPGRPGESRSEALERLQREQAELQRQLGELMDRLGEQGFEPGERMGDAQRSMGDAGDALSQDRAGQAVDEQSEALQALREGAQDMAQQLAEAQEQDGSRSDQAGAGQPGPGRDPLGRTSREGTFADTSRVGVPDEIDAQTARRILRALRQRLGDVDLPRFERDYLERLLP